MEKKSLHYEQRLAATLLLTHFSYFEAFVKDVILEMIEFHGGANQFQGRIERRTKAFLAPHIPDVAGLKRRLQDSENPGWKERYRKYSAKLAATGFRFPGDLLAAYGVRKIILKVKRLRAVDIPELLIDALRMNLPSTQIDKYREIRTVRNNIAHGKPPHLTINKSIQMNKELRTLAIMITTHLTENFFVIEKYAP